MLHLRFAIEIKNHYVERTVGLDLAQYTQDPIDKQGPSERNVILDIHIIEHSHKYYTQQ